MPSPTSNVVAVDPIDLESVVRALRAAAREFAQVPNGYAEPVDMIDLAAADRLGQVVGLWPIVEALPEAFYR